MRCLHHRLIQLSSLLPCVQFAQTHLGTPYYMSPEEVDGQPYNEKSDLWSVGCLIYELAALSPPFKAQSQLQLALRIKEGRVSPLPTRFSDDLGRVVRALLQVDPTRRPDVEDLLRVPRVDHYVRESKHCHGREDRLSQVIHLILP